MLEPDVLLMDEPTNHLDVEGILWLERLLRAEARAFLVVSHDRPIGDLLPLFASTGHHHVPVIDGERRLVGMITQSDVVGALARAE